MGGEPNSIDTSGGVSYIVGDNGYIYYTEDPTAGVTVADAGSATVDTLRDVYAFSAEFAVAVGDNGAVVYTSNGTNWSLATRPVGVGITLNCVLVLSQDTWIVGTSNGLLYYTTNGGSTWTTVAFPGSGSGSVKDLKRSTDSVIWMAHQTSGTKGRILRSYDAGKDWEVTPEKAGTSIPAADKYNALAVCENDANFVVGVGLADDGSDGIIIVGKVI